MVKSIFFACNMNSIRSPMAAAILKAEAGDRINVDSAGVYEGGPDPFIDGVLREIGVALGDFEPKSMNDLEIDDFDLAIVLTPEAAAEARKFLSRDKIEFWDIDNPTDVRGGRDELLTAYRAARDDIRRKIAARFPEFHEKP